MPRTVRKGPARGAGSLRIIGGQYRGRRLDIADLEGLRPTGDRQRETLFNWLQIQTPGARVLDAFAGTGALGLEAASRGAQQVWLLEKQPRAVSSLKAAVATLGCTATVVQCDALVWLARAEADPFDLVFLDPPFAAVLWEEALAALIAHQRLADRAVVYLECPRHQAIAVPAGLELMKEKHSGDVSMRLYQWSGQAMASN
ncbi:16S rRNA (guanine(966)-N(2))-methyltransferase RsmD [Saccharospirillum impatiens]|uniref:16S rRNA (guanine(966)-N(2))-methyltransferase RsmD n=1 Tax=Saccharospirillum impatiens TaxID=169438 RepID=UPI0003FA8F92|nr:16S rRNA (guanine(966)-N(2))-methyltransferase RsmD [Saccharospirillum impatiens]